MDGRLMRRPANGHQSHRAKTTETAGMFERDDLFTALRLRDLRAAADQARTAHIDASGLIGRARRSVGRGLVEIGNAIAGVRSAAPVPGPTPASRADFASRATHARRPPCDDHELGATA